MRMMLGQRALT